MSLSTGAKELLRNFWSDHPQKSEDPEVLEKLDKSYQQLVNMFEICPSLLYTIEAFAASENPAISFHPKPESGQPDLPSVYNPQNNTVYIQRNLQYSWGEVDFQCITTLAHEIAHAVTVPVINKDVPKNSAMQIDVSKVTFTEFLHLTNKAEGAAIYYELLALSELATQETYRKMYGDDLNRYERPAWRDNQIFPESSFDFYKKASEIMGDTTTSPDEKMVLLGEKINTQLSQGPLWTLYQGNNVKASDTALLTYDEMSRLNWLFNHTDVAIDYLEARGITGFLDHDENMTTFERGNGDHGMQAIRIILQQFNGGHDLKVLVNQYNGYLGTDDVNPETIHAKDDSALGKEYGHEVLWGGGGTDTLKGSETQDIQEILLGGDGVDYLYGYGGDDRLAGNIGDDYLYGGKNNNYLAGGQNLDSYIVGEGHDTIFDSDGDGNIYYGSVSEENRLTGGKLKRLMGAGIENEYTSEDGKYIYIFTPDNGQETDLGRLDIYRVGENGREANPFATVEGFRDPALGINLQPQNSPAARAPESPQGNDLGLSFEIIETAPPEQYAITSQTYDRVTLNAAGHVSTGVLSDWVTGSKFDDVIYLGEGNSDLALGQGGDDYIDGGTGRDYIVGGAKVNQAGVSDNDVIVGGMDEDILHGGAGNDLIYADDKARTDLRDSSEKATGSTAVWATTKSTAAVSATFCTAGPGPIPSAAGKATTSSWATAALKA
jgi:Ca2+-binding RTX toxin-like protein